MVLGDLFQSNCRAFARLGGRLLVGGLGLSRSWWHDRRSRLHLATSGALVPRGAVVPTHGLVLCSILAAEDRWDCSCSLSWLIKCAETTSTIILASIALAKKLYSTATTASYSLDPSSPQATDSSPIITPTSAEYYALLPVS